MPEPITELIQAEVDDNGARDVDDLPSHVRRECIAHHLDELVGQDLPAALEFIAEEPNTTNELHLLAHVVRSLKNDKPEANERAIGREILRRAETYYRDWLQGQVDEAAKTSEDRQERKVREQNVDAEIHRQKGSGHV